MCEQAPLKRNVAREEREEPEYERLVDASGEGRNSRCDDAIVRMQVIDAALLGVVLHRERLLIEDDAALRVLRVLRVLARVEPLLATAKRTGMNRPEQGKGLYTKSLPSARAPLEA